MNRFFMGSALYSLFVIIFAIARGNGGEVAVYDGTGSDLQTTPSFAGGDGITTSFFPSTNSSGNTVTIDFTAGDNPYRVFGGVSETEAAMDNSVTLSAGTVSNDVFGGYTFGTDMEATGNTVTVDGSVSAQIIMGGNSLHGAAKSNTVTIHSGDFLEIWGGQAGGATHDAANNSVLMTGGTVANNITGAYVAGSGKGVSNSVAVSGGTVGGNIYGAYTSAGDAVENQVFVSGTASAWNVVGGYSVSGSVRGNEVFFSGGSVNGIWAGDTGGGDAYNNAIVMTGGTVTNGLTGAYVDGVGIGAFNTVSISGGSVGGNINGASTNAGDAVENRVIVSGTASVWNVVGGYSASGSVKGNEVVFEGGTVNGIWAGDTGSGDAFNNAIVMTDGTVTNGLTGAYVGGTGIGAYNTVIVSGGSVGGYINGAWISAGDAVENRVIVSGTASVRNVVGGYSASGSVKGNEVLFEGGSVNGIWAGDTRGGNAYNNAIVMTGGTVTDGLTGAYVGGTGTAAYNTVTLSGGTVGNDIFGAYASDGDALNNTVMIKNGQVNNGIICGHTLSSVARGNTVIVEGGRVDGFSYGGMSANGDALGNSVIVKGGIVEGLVGGSGYNSAGVVQDNLVVVYDGVFVNSNTGKNYIEGGVNWNTVATGDVVLNNHVTIYDGDLTLCSTIYGGWTNSGNAVNNSVSIHGGIGIGNIYGGRSDADGMASYNQVVISGGEFRTDVTIAGGRGSTPDNSNATHNTVRLSGAPVFERVQLYGGLDPNNSTGNVFQGNRLEVFNYSGSALGSVANFEFYDFLVPTSLVSGGAALVLEGSVSFPFGSDISNSITSVNFSAGGSGLAVNDRITLIHDQNTLTANNINSSVQARHGSFIRYDLDLFADASDLYAVVRRAGAVPEAKSLSEGRSASLSFIRQGQDLLVDSGFAAAETFLGQTGDGWSGLSVFGAVGGGHFRHKTGSHVDVDGVSILTGLAWRNNGPCGSLLLGAFFETGYADYDTHNAFASGRVRGDGDSRYAGGGVLGRYDWQIGLYLEASGRAGGVRNKFDSDMTDMLGDRVRYTLNSAYFGAHVGTGYQWRISEQAMLDMSVKYLWSRQNSDSVVITGDPVSFDADDSHRVRTGARFSYAVNSCISPYIGAAYEYEFRGKSRAGAYGYGFGVPSLKGGTGIGEIGVAFRRHTFSADLGVKGHTGRRDGVTGSLNLKWMF